MKNFPHTFHRYVKRIKLILFAAVGLFIATTNIAYAGIKEFFSDLVGGAFNIIGSGIDKLVGGVFQYLMYIIEKIASEIASLAAQGLDIAIQFSLDPVNLSLPGILTGWTIFRDLANMTFIFILLYIAIMTILRLSSFETRKILVNLIIVALLVNFSFFLTGFVIDVGNATGAIIYDAMTPPNTDVGQMLHQNLKLPLAEDETTAEDATHIQKGFMHIFNAIALLIAAFVFIAGASLFIVRQVVLMFLLILSPLAFVAAILPGTQNQWRKWFHKLVENTFVAPIYLLMIAVVLGITNTPGLFSQAQRSRAFITGGETQEQIAVSFISEPGLLLNYVIIIGLLVAALVVSKNIAGSTATASTRFAGRAIGMGAGGGAWLGRNIVGRGAARQYAQKGSAWRAVRDDPTRSRAERFAARMKLATAKGAANASFDARGGVAGKTIGATAGAALGAGGIKVNVGKASGKGGYQKRLDEKTKAHRKELDAAGLTEHEKEVYKASKEFEEKRQKISADNLSDIQGTAKSRLRDVDDELKLHQRQNTSVMSDADKAAYRRKEKVLLDQKRTIQDRIKRHTERAKIVLEGRAENIKTVGEERKEKERGRKEAYVKYVRNKWNILTDHKVIADDLEKYMNKDKKEKDVDRLFEQLNKDKKDEISKDDTRNAFEGLFGDESKKT